MPAPRGAAMDRRTLLTAVGGGFTVGIAGCLDDNDDDRPAAVSLDDGQACDQCGMVIDQHPGPTGQVFFDSHLSERDGPAWFCSVACTYRYRFDRESEGFNPRVTYLTDYSHVEHSVNGGSTPSISAHLDADAHREASELSVVVDSDVQGAMGPELIPFGDRDDAESFAAEYDGQVRSAAELDRELVDSVISL